MKKNEWVWFALTLAALLVMALLLRVAHASEAVQSDPVLATLEGYGKVGLGVASFAALVWFLRQQTAEVRAMRVDFLLALDKRDAHDAMQQNLNREASARQTATLHESIDSLAAEVRYTNGRDR